MRSWNQLLLVSLAGLSSVPAALTKLALILILSVVAGPRGYAADATALRAGEGVTDITPPPGTELAGFHKPPGKERLSTGVRQPASARALVFGNSPTNEFAIVSLDVCSVSQEFCRDVKQAITRSSGIPAENIRIGATHTHSMPTLRYFRQWGRLPEDYRQMVATQIVQAVSLAKKDLNSAKLFLGKDRVEGASHNRTSETFKTEDLFTKESNDDERWLDRTLHALYFVRDGTGRNLLWYQFSAHPVCYADESTGPDFPGLVASKIKTLAGISPSFLQGHCGDVNSGTSGRGDAEKVSDAVVKSLQQAIKSARPVDVTQIRQVSGTFHAPLDIEFHKRQLEEYRADPTQCTKGPWVDAEFAREWYDIASKWNLAQESYATPISALCLGDVALLFHPGELYSVYGLTIRRDSPFRDTLVIGYVDDLIGYIPDPKAYVAKEYSAMVVPKIMSLPCYKPEVGRALTAAGLDLLRKLK
jgi:neutral ceramidase